VPSSSDYRPFMAPSLCLSCHVAAKEPLENRFLDDPNLVCILYATRQGVSNIQVNDEVPIDVVFALTELDQEIIQRFRMRIGKGGRFEKACSTKGEASVHHASSCSASSNLTGMSSVWRGIHMIVVHRALRRGDILMESMGCVPATSQQKFQLPNKTTGSCSRPKTGSIEG